MFGADHTNIVGSLQVDEISRVLWDEQPLIDQFAKFHERLEATGGTRAASLFALPDPGYSRMRDTAIITWYTDQSGAARAFADLDAEERGRAEVEVSARLAEIADSADPELSRMLQLALNVASPEWLVLVEGEPVIVNWGLLPSPVAQSGEGYAAHISETVGRVLPAGVMLVRELEEDTAAEAGAVPDAGNEKENDGAIRNASAAGAVAGATGVAAGSTAAAEGGGPVNPTGAPGAGGGAGGPGGGGHFVYDHRRGWGWGALTAGVFLLCMLVFFIYMLWPGNLVYPAQAESRFTAEQQIALDNASAAAIHDQIERLQIALNDDICVSEDNYALDGLAGVPVVPSVGGGQSDPETVPGTDVGDGDTALPGVDDDADSAALPEDENTDTPGDPTGGLDSPALLNRLDSSTVFVISSVADGVSTGSGVIVSPEYVLTNYHVVQEGDGRRLLVTNQLIGTVEAEMVASTQSSEIGARDFALLRLEHPVDVTPARLTTGVERLDPVIAAGFPAFIIESDPSFVAAFYGGDASQLNRVQMAVTQGVVMAEQASNGVTVIAHSATISSGNSGGPLVDRCARVVGINTFARTDAENALRNNYALSVGDAAAFLNANGVSPAIDTSACTINAPAPSTDDAPAPNADAAPDDQASVADSVETVPDADDTVVEDTGDPADTAPTVSEPNATEPNATGADDAEGAENAENGAPVVVEDSPVQEPVEQEEPIESDGPSGDAEADGLMVQVE